MSLKEFGKVVKDFLIDLLSTFPELQPGLDARLAAVVKSDEDPAVKEVFDYVAEKWPPHFLDIMGEKTTMFDTECFLFPSVNFQTLWSANITDKTKQIIWKYLKLVMLTMVGNLNGATAAFDGLNEEEIRSKLEETTKDIHDFFKDLPVPDPEAFNDHLKGMMSGKLGQLAKEIADETVGSTTAESVENLIKDPSKMFGLVQTVGEKIDNKLKTGELKESELLEEASEMLTKVKNMPGLDQLFKKFAGGGKIDLSAMQTKLNQNAKAAKTKERLQQKLKERKEASAAEAPAPEVKKKKKKKKKPPAAAAAPQETE